MSHKTRNQKPRNGQPSTAYPVDPQDLSDQKQIEKVLARISDSFVALDTNWVYTYVNEKAAQTFERTPEQLIGKHIWTEFPEGIGQPFYQALYKAVETQQPIYLEEYYPPYDRWFENRIFPSKDGLSIFFSDITDRKKAEQAVLATQELIEASEKRLSLIFDTVSDVTFLLSVEPEDCFRFVSINPAFLRVTGLRNEQVAGKRIEEVLPEPAHAQVIAQYKQAIRENRAVRWEEVSAYPTGTLYGEVTVTPFRNTAGVCTHLVGVVHDITEIRLAEIENRRLNQELEHRVADRTAQLQAANRELKSFSYSVSHDLRAPLRAISGFATIIARRHRKDLNAEGQHYLDNIVQASERMGKLIDELLTYSRLGREGVRRVPVSLASLIAELKRIMQSRLDEIHAEVVIANDLPTVIGDQTLLSQVFTNLLENAITYHKPNVPPKVTIDWQTEGDQVVIRVRDNGIGIPVEYQEKIFHMFQRLHNEDEYPGTGIGLANVKKCLDLLSGHVAVESSVDQGATFSIYLPKE